MRGAKAYKKLCSVNIQVVSYGTNKIWLYIGRHTGMNCRTTPTLPFHVCRVFTRNQKSTHTHTNTAHKIFLTQRTIWKYSSRFTCRALQPTRHLLRHLIPFTAISTLASASWTARSIYRFFPFWPRNANGRICPQVRSTLSELRQGVLMAPTGMRGDDSDGHLRRNSSYFAWNNGISDGTRSC